MSAQSPFKLQEAGPTDRAMRVVESIAYLIGSAMPMDVSQTDLAEIIDREAGIRELIGAHNDLVLRFEDEHECRLRLGVDLKSLRMELAEAYADSARIVLEMDSKLNALREAMQQGILALRLIGSQPDKFACAEVKHVSRDAADELEKAIALSKVERPE